MANYPVSWKMDVGVNHVPAYQVSGRPFASGNIDAQAPSGSKGRTSPTPTKRDANSTAARFRQFSKTLGAPSIRACECAI